MSHKTSNSFTQSLYQAFHFNTKKKYSPMDYVRNSKKLVLNTKSYFSYSNYYEKITTINSFKLPNMKNYPVRKNINLISLKKLENPMKWKKKREYDTETRKRAVTAKAYRRTEGPMTQDQDSNVFTDSTIGIHQNHFKQLNNSNYCLNESSLLKYIDDFNNINILYKYISYKEKYSLPSHTSDFSYFAKILQEMDWGNDIVDKPSQKVNEFNISNNFFHVSLKCCSLTVIFTKEEIQVNNLGNPTSEYQQEISFPFELLSFFYGLSYNDLKLFLAFVISYDKGTSTFSLNEYNLEQYYYVFNKDKEFYGPDCLFLLLNKPKQPLQFDYLWITEHNVFKFTLKLPFYQFNINPTDKESLSDTMSIEKAIDTRYLIHFMKTAFKDWDLFLMNSLSEYKEFRSTVNQYLSFNPNKQIRCKLVLGKLYKKQIEDLTDSVWGFFYTNEQNESVYMKLNSIKVQAYFPENNYRERQFFKFNLTLNETKQLFFASSYMPIEEIIKRCLAINVTTKNIIEEEIKVDLSLKGLEGVENIEDPSQINLNIMDNYASDNKKVKYHITIIYPFIDWECYSPGNLFFKKVYDLPHEASTILMKLSIKEWKKIIGNQLSIATKEAHRISLKEDIFGSSKNKYLLKKKKTSCHRIKTKIISCLLIPKIDIKSHKLLK